MFEVPLGVILDRSAHDASATSSGTARASRRTSSIYGGRRIWGATAAILRNFQDVILDEGET